MNTTPKSRPCAYDKCKREFLPVRPMQKVCGPLCASRWTKAKAAAKKAAEREQFRARRMALERIPNLVKKAQVAFNAYIRSRDENQPCVCCGQSLRAGEVGGAYDAGHYRSVGSASHLRFDERNVHAQKKACNRYGAGRAVDYRIGLISRIGLAAVEALEADNTPRKWTREELRGIAATYRAKLKQLKEKGE